MAITKTEEESYKISSGTYYCDYRGQNIPVKVDIERIIFGQHGKVGSKYTYKYDGYYKLYLSFGGSINGEIGSLQLFQNGVKVDSSVGFYAPDGECERELRMDDFPAKLNSESDEITCRIHNEAFIDVNGKPLDIIDTFKIKDILPNIAFEIVTAPNFSDDADNVTISLNDWDTYKGKYNNNTVSLLTLGIDKIQAIISFDGTTPNIVRDLTKWVYEQWEEDDIWYEDEYMDFLYNFKEKTYTFIFTPEEKQALINAVTNGSSKEITFQVVTIPFEELNEGVPFYSNLKRTFTLIDAQPILNPIVEDGNTKTAELTGDINTFIKYHSEAVYAINAETKKNATISHQQITCGNKINTSPYGSIKGVESGTFLFTVVDSRDLIAHQVIEKPLVPYVHLTANITKNSATPDGTMIFTISGNYYNGSFGVKNNSLIVRYSYRSADDEIFQDMVIVAPSLITINDDHTYKATITVNGLDYRKDYFVKVNVWDLLENITTKEEYIGFTPIFDWSKNDFNFNIPVAYTDRDDTYSISDVAKKFDKLDFSREDFAKVKGLFNSLSKRYELPIHYLGVGANYSNVDVSLFLYGNTIRGYMTANRKTAIAAGNQANEMVCQIEFDSGFKVTGFGAVSFVSGTSGGITNFQMTETQVYPNDGSVSDEAVGKGRFNIMLCASASGGDEFNAYFTFPALIDLTKFEE